MASDHQALTDICSTAPHQNYICNFTDKNIKTYKQKNWNKFFQKNNLWPISENKSIGEKKKRFYKMLSNRKDELNKMVC